MQEINLTVTSESAGSRLDAFLASRLSVVSRSAIQRAIESSEILVNERPAKASYKLRAGDEIQVELSEPEPLTAQPENIPLTLLHEDHDIIVINKPAGMVVHPGAGIVSGTLANALVFHLQQQSVTSGAGSDPLRPGIVHRLDVGTSGLMVAAKHERAQIHLSRQFAERKVEKKYIALVYGNLKSDRGKIEEPLGRDPRNRIRMAIRPRGQGRSALTLYEVKERFCEFTLLDVEIKTGRTHQIRVHLSHHKHPIVGDQAYDQGRSNSVKSLQAKSAIQKLSRPFLHAASLSFTHPGNGARLFFHAPLPEDLSEMLTLLRNL